MRSNPPANVRTRTVSDPTFALPRSIEATPRETLAPSWRWIIQKTPTATLPTIKIEASQPRNGFLSAPARNARPNAMRRTGQNRRRKPGVSGGTRPSRIARRSTPATRRSVPKATFPKFIREAVSRDQVRRQAPSSGGRPMRRYLLRLCRTSKVLARAWIQPAWLVVGPLRSQSFAIEITPLTPDSTRANPTIVETLVPEVNRDMSRCGGPRVGVRRGEGTSERSEAQDGARGDDRGLRRGPGGAYDAGPRRGRRRIRAAPVPRLRGDPLQQP